MASTLDIRAPADQTEGTRSQVLRWLKAVGDTVTEHEPLIELETDKVTVEVAAPASGVLREIVKAEQEEIAPGDVLGRLETADGSERAAGSGATAADATATATATATHAISARGSGDPARVYSAAGVGGQGANTAMRAVAAGEGAAAGTG